MTRYRLHNSQLTSKLSIALSIAFGLFMVILLASVFSVNNGRDVSAAPAFNPGHIISDSEMRRNSMSVSAIQSFLNAKGVACTSGSNCLKNYRENNKSAAQIIYDTGRAYNINPQVLIVLLQKEVGLVTINNPASWRYQSATGYGCPDSTPGVCNSKYFGFSNQLRWSATMFNAILSNSPYWYSPYVVGQNNILYHPYNNCGTQRVNIQNRATAALYSYTPYVPNKAALAAGYGTGDICSSYGNRNFHNYYYDWFGVYTKGAIGARHVELGGNSGILGKPLANEVARLDGGRYQVFANGVISWHKNSGAWETRGAIREQYKVVGFESGVLGYPTSGEVKLTNGGRYQQFEKGRIYWTREAGAWDVRGAVLARYTELEAEKSHLGYPTSSEVKISDGGRYQQFEGGYIYWSKPTNAMQTRGAIGDRYRNIPSNTSTLGYPVSDEMKLSDGGRYQQFEKGRIYWSRDTKAWEVSENIGDKYIEMGAQSHFFGYPVASPVKIPSGAYQAFQKGRIYWSSETNTQTVHGGIQAYYLGLGGHLSRLKLPISGESKSNGEVHQKFQGGTVIWTSKKTRVIYL